MNTETPNISLEQRLTEMLRHREHLTSPQPGPNIPCTLVGCDEKTRTAELAFRTEQWMSNPAGVVHGGVVSILVDNSMGIVSHAFYGRMNPTISMTVNFLRPVPVGSTVIVRARVTSPGRTASHTCAELYLQDDPDHILVTASGVYYTRQ